MTLHPVIALVDDTGRFSADYLAAVAGALNEQIHDDFVPVWGHGVSASVVAATPAPNQWAVRIQRTLDEPGALGYHTDEHNQPVAYIMAQSESDTSVTISHEVLEMLRDPFGNRMHTGRAPMGIDPGAIGYQRASQRVHYLLEACDPCEATSYQVGGVALSDFLLPGWYRTSPMIAPAYSHAGGCRHPREVANDGYVSFATDDGTWWQVFNEGGSLQVRNLGRFDKSQFGSLREFTDFHARVQRAAA